MLEVTLAESLLYAFIWASTAAASWLRAASEVSLEALMPLVGWGGVVLAVLVAVSRDALCWEAVGVPLSQPLHHTSHPSAPTTIIAMTHLIAVPILMLIIT
jgi:hypothetical protein